MADRELSSFFEGILFQYFGKPRRVQSIRRLGGGCIDQATRVSTEHASFVIKWKEGVSDQFEKEAHGLRLLKASNTIGIPEVFHVGRAHHRSYILMEYVAPSAPAKSFWAAFGESLAGLHLKCSSDRFGLETDNYIGSLAQKNRWHHSWPDFFIKQRLEVQAAQAFDNRLLPKKALEQLSLLYDRLPRLLPDATPALLHGDLWSGNVLVGTQGLPYLIDPAVYFGCHETELAFTQLFGGFEPMFYHSYSEVYPTAPDFNERIDLYNLYPLLVHLNLFGASYLNSILTVLRKFT